MTSLVRAWTLQLRELTRCSGLSSEGTDSGFHYVFLKRLEVLTMQSCMGSLLGKCIIWRFCHVHIIECTVTNLDGTAHCTPWPHGTPPSHTWPVVDQNIITSIYTNSSSLNLAFCYCEIWHTYKKVIKSSYRATNTRTLLAPQMFPSQPCWSETPMTHRILQVLRGTRSPISFRVPLLGTLTINNTF